MSFKVTVQSLGFDEELYRFPVLHALVQVFEQRFLCLVWTGGVAEIIEEEQFCAAVSFKELYLAVDTFLGFVDRLSVLCL